MSAFFEYYKIFYFVARTGSITKAANFLSVTQPSVTKSVHSLEKQLGCSLFIRSKKGVALTREGQMLFRKIQPACELIFSAEDDLEALKEMRSGIMRIGANELTFTSWLLPHVKAFKQKYPDVKIKIENMTNSDVCSVLEGGNIDFAVLSSPIDVENSRDYSGFEIKYVGEFQDVPVCGPDFFDVAQKRRYLHEFTRFPLISMPEGTSTRIFYSKFFEKHSLLFQPDIELSSVDQITRAIREGLGVGFVPLNVAETSFQEGTLRQIDLEEKIPVRYNCIITAYSNPPGVTARTFIEQFEDLKPGL
ncbi:DNA-binding transcriptional LysR family regulator [Catenibacillus scindens]|uniref:DNA-binding transcriptional LysR family regulator n=1 Tax=Catenibacillus scindens TaxID=673271 RepID=A0A7W8M572_9FIRM|nr:LysR family transcriptional regulator [Catenibacillus scindens]MBB5264938.1 DNA-binding transcriptional LysR family regulator [Catenibacillus scindens]